VDSTLYCRIVDSFVQQLDDVQLTQGYYQQDSATCHTSNVSMELIESFFPNRVISKELWPLKSPELTNPNFLSLEFTEGQGVCKQTAYVTGQHFC
jgi:hypothetical protein